MGLPISSITWLQIIEKMMADLGIPMSKEKRMIRAIEAAGLTWWLMFNFVLFFC
jgi:hypothetical protein